MAKSYSCRTSQGGSTFRKINNMKKILSLLLCLCFAGTSPADDSGKPDLWFHVGEKLTYQIYWGVIPVGEAIIWSEWIKNDGRDLVVVKVTAKTNKWMDKIYPVSDYMETIIDPAQFLPLSFYRDVSEGRYRLKEITTFNHQAGKAHWKHLLKEDEHDFDIDPDTRDLISFMYYMRSKEMEVGTTYEYRIMADEKLYDLIIRPVKKEKVRLSALGERIKSLKYEPDAKFQGLFVRVGKLTVWVSDDDRKIATKINARVPVASVQLELKKVEGPGDDIYTKATRERNGQDEDEELDEE